MRRSACLSSLLHVLLVAVAVAPASAQDPWDDPFDNPFNSAIGNSAAQAARAAIDGRVEIARLNMVMAQSRQRYWTLWPDAPGFEEATQEFGSLLWQKDLLFLMNFVVTGPPTPTLDRSLQPVLPPELLVFRVMGEIDGGLDERAENFFYSWVDAVRRELGVERRGELAVAAVNPFALLDAVEKTSDAYERYRKVRDRGEFFRSPRSPLRSSDPAEFLAGALVYGNAEETLVAGRETVRRIETALGPEAVRHAVSSLKQGRSDLTAVDYVAWVNMGLPGLLKEGARDDARALLATMYGWSEEAERRIQGLFERYGERRVLEVAEQVRTAPLNSEQTDNLADDSGRPLKSRRWWFETLLEYPETRLPALTEPLAPGGEPPALLPRNASDREMERFTVLNHGLRGPGFEAERANEGYAQELRSQVTLRTTGETGEATILVQLSQILLFRDLDGGSARPPRELVDRTPRSRRQGPVRIRDLKWDAARIEALDRSGVRIQVPFTEAGRTLEHVSGFLDGRQETEALPYVELYAGDAAVAEYVVSLMEWYLAPPGSVPQPERPTAATVGVGTREFRPDRRSLPPPAEQGAPHDRRTSPPPADDDSGRAASGRDGRGGPPASPTGREEARRQPQGRDREELLRERMRMRGDPSAPLQAEAVIEYDGTTIEFTGDADDIAEIEAAAQYHRNARACLLLGELIAHGKIERDINDALHILELGGQGREGDPECTARLAQLLIEGHVAEPKPRYQNPASWRQYARNAGRRGSALGMYLYAECMAKGIGGRPSEKTARDWYQKAAAAGHALARRWCEENDVPYEEPAAGG